MDEIKLLEQQLENLKAQANLEIGKILGKLELLKQQNEKNKKGTDKNSRQPDKPDSPKTR